MRCGIKEHKMKQEMEKMTEWRRKDINKNIKIKGNGARKEVKWMKGKDEEIKESLWRMEMVSRHLEGGRLQDK